MGLADTAAKDYMRNRERFADAFNYFVFGGRQVILPESLTELDANEVLFRAEPGNGREALQRFRDALDLACVMKGGHATYILLGLEDQMKVHYAMPVRDMLMDAMRYARQVSEIREGHRRAGDWADGEEFLSGIHRDDRLAPVVTLVIFWSPKAWDGPRSIHEMLSPMDEELRTVVADYRINLLSPAEVEDFGRFRTGLGQALEYIKYSGDKKALREAVMNSESFKKVDRQTADFVNVVTKSDLKYAEEEETVDMCQAIKDIREEGREEGRAEGRVEGRAEGREESTLGYLRSLMETLQFTAEQALAALKVPEQEWDKYMQKI